MALFRQIHTSFWNDPDVEEWTFEQKGFFLYLITNSHSRQCGISEVSIRQIQNETGLPEKRVFALLEFFESIGKVVYNQITKELAIRNWKKYNVTTGAKIEVCIKRELALVKDAHLIGFLDGGEYPISSPKIPYSESRHGYGNNNKDKISINKIKEEKRENARANSLAEVTAVFVERNYPDAVAEAEKFWNHYEANGWTQGRNKPIKNWKAAAAGWASRHRDFQQVRNFSNGKSKPPSIDESIRGITDLTPTLQDIERRHHERRSGG